MKVISCLIIMLVSVVVLFGRCGSDGSNHADRYNKQNRVIDSLTAELSKRTSYEAELNAIGVLLDSIDANRFLLRIELDPDNASPSYLMYHSRLNEINEWVKSTQAQLEIAEHNKLRTSRMK